MKTIKCKRADCKGCGKPCILLPKNGGKCVKCVLPPRRDVRA